MKLIMKSVESVSAWGPGLAFGAWFGGLSYGWQLTVAALLLVLAWALLNAVRYGIAYACTWVCAKWYGLPLEAFCDDDSIEAGCDWIQV